MAEITKLATKYRPKNITEYEGNDYIKTTVLNSFNEEPFPSSVEFIGNSGNGKTTIARLLAKRIVCESPKEVEYNGKMVKISCDECTTCQLMDEFIETGDDSNLINVKELDATKQGRKEDIEAFIEEASSESILNATGMVSVNIVDEYHGISKDAQNAFLKFMEDSPENTVFIFCTTDPNKVIKTLRTRIVLSGLVVDRPTIENMVNSTRRVCEAEGFSYTQGGLTMLAERSNFTYRVLLNNLERVARVQNNTITTDTVSETLGVKDLSFYFDFIRHLRARNMVLYSGDLHKVRLESDFNTFIDDLRDFVSRGLYVLYGHKVEGITDKELKNFKALFTQFSMVEIEALLSFLQKAKVGDIEINLMVLGTKGLVPKESKAEEEPPSKSIVVTDDDVTNEKRAVSVSHKMQQEEKLKTTLTKVEDDLQDIDNSDVLKDFGF